MYILGISAYYHDSAAALIKDGDVICAIEEERFTRKKHDNSFPFHAIQWCLKSESITINDVNYISYYEKPLLKFERILETWISTFPFSLKPFVKGLPEWLDYKIKVEYEIKKKLKYNGKVLFVPHHLSHASASYFPSSFKDASILTIDGVGEYDTTVLWYGKSNSVKKLRSINFPHSIGLLYSTFTAFLGYKINEDEYKVMGLAAYGKPIYRDKISKVVDVKKDGSFKLNLSYFSFREDFTMWSKKFETLFGKPRKPNEPISKRHKDIAASIQEVTEEIYFKILNYLYILTNSKNLCVSGGVGLNALANGKIFTNTPFKKIYIFGAAGDNGCAIGSALFTYCALLNNKKNLNITNLCIGVSLTNEEIEAELRKLGVKYKKYNDEEKLIKKTAKLLSEGKIVGWFQGNMEFGPRALGARSILARPWPRIMKEKVNIVKRREQFRPFAGSVLEEDIAKYFEIPPSQSEFPFMNFCFKVNVNKRKDLAAIVHEDGTCRIQTVSKENKRYYKLIKEFKKMTNISCILNTSFNLRGEPIVNTVKEAIRDFNKSELDYLVIGDFIVS